MPAVEAQSMFDEGVGAPARSGASRVCGNQILVKLYYDIDAKKTRGTHFNHWDATIFKRFGIHLKASGDWAQIITDNYPKDSDDPSLLKYFATHDGSDPAGADIVLLLTRNDNIANRYGNTLGRGYWGNYVWENNQWVFHCGVYSQNYPQCWVKRGGSDYQIRIVGLQEMSHVMGACWKGGVCPANPDDVSNDKMHRDNVIRKHQHCSCLGALCVCWDHSHYSIMKSSYSGKDDEYDDNWINADFTLLQGTIKNTAGHFCAP